MPFQHHSCKSCTDGPPQQSLGSGCGPENKIRADGITNMLAVQRHREASLPHECSAARRLDLCVS